MALQAQSKLGPYEILSAIGAGGQGEVYKAKDTRLDRTVAIKVLPSNLASRPELRERFEREARTVSSLNHPHICTLYDIGVQDGIHFLVMEYLEGQTLADRLAKGALPLGDALRFAIEIADALDKAHRQGVVHRDLKPGNIMITKSGAKLLDFGLARQSPVASTAGTIHSEAPTAGVAPLTAEGTILGTLQYMSPEQLEGREADARSDIFAFGATLYELVTGCRAFNGTSQVSLMASILERDPPPISSLQPIAPKPLGRLVELCLKKDPDKRCQTMADIRLRLEEISEPGVEIETRNAGVSAQRYRLPWLTAAIAVAVLVAATALAMRYLNVNRMDAPVRAFLCNGEAGPQCPMGAEISPDGQSIVYIVTSGSDTGLWIRELTSETARPLANTSGASDPFWSPDGHFLGFFAGNKLKVIAAAGGTARTLADAAGERGGSWSETGDIVYSSKVIFKVPSEGGAATAVTANDPGFDSFDGWPQFLPDGRHFLFTRFRRPQRMETALFVGAVDGAAPKPLLDKATSGYYAAPGYLIYNENASLFARPFDPKRLTFAGKAQIITDDLDYNPNIRIGTFSVSNAGRLIYGTGGAYLNGQLVWFDRNGNSVGTVGQADVYRGFDISPDEQTLAVDRLNSDAGVDEIWLLRIGRNAMTRFAFEAGSNYLPIWSFNGRELFFGSNRSGHPGIYSKPSAGIGDETLIADLPSASWGSSLAHASISADGRWILYTADGADGRVTNLDILSLTDKTSKPYLAHQFDERAGEFSPDGHYVAYLSRESGRTEAYVSDYPETSQKTLVSVGDASEPKWSKDGKELFYLGRDGISDWALMVADVAHSGAAIEFKPPRPLFKVKLGGGSRFVTNYYAVSKDSKRFLFNVAPDNSNRTSILVTNWTGLLK